MPVQSGRWSAAGLVWRGMNAPQLVSLDHFLEQSGIAFEFITKPETQSTEHTAALTGIPLFEITKSLVCLTSGNKAYVAIIPGDHTVVLKRVAQVFGARKSRLCPAETVEDYSGYRPRSTPPLHFRNVQGVVVDERLLALDWLYGGGGRADRIVKLRTRDVIELNDATVADVAQWVE